MKNYITPSILKYQNVDDLLKNNNKNYSLFGINKLSKSIGVYRVGTISDLHHGTFVWQL